jgi:hypothetical protein
VGITVILLLEQAEQHAQARLLRQAVGQPGGGPHRIRAFIEATNADPKPFRWLKSADAILASVKRLCLRALEAEPKPTSLS